MPADHSQTIEEAREHHHAGRLDEAAALLREVLLDEPENADALHFLGLVLLQLGRGGEATDLIERALKINPSNVDALNNLGLAHESQDRLDDAVTAFKKAIAAAPGYAPAHSNLGDALLKMDAPEMAVTHYETALEVDPDDSDILGSLGMALAQLGKLDKSLGCFHRALESEPGNPFLHNNFGATLLEDGQLDAAAEAFDRAIAIHPDFDHAHIALGNVRFKQERLDEAITSYHKALAIRPKNATTHNRLGMALQGLGHLDEAITSYHKALAIEPDYAEAHYNLGNAFLGLGKLDEAVASYHKALAIKPDYVKAHNNLGNALHDLGKLDEAVASYHMALAIKPDFAMAHRNIGMAQLLMGDFQNGWKNCNYRWLCDDFASVNNNFATKKNNYDKLLWQGQTIYGKRLLVWEEQGIGEKIIFTSMIPDLVELGANIILGCEKRLIPLFSRSFPTITCANIDDPDIGNAEDTKFDLHTPLGSIGRWVRTDFASFPTRPSYLVADSQQRQTLRKRYLMRGNDVLVGIAWYSNNPSYGVRKSITLLDLRPLLEVPGITFIDLQYGDTSEERKAFTAETGIEVFHDDGIDQMVDLDSFASQVAAMDMVVTISNTTAHIAGALGIPTLLLLGAVPLWYWLLERDDNPWYPSLRLFRQQNRGDHWQEVVERARNELADLVRD